ncbi:MAG: PQQ-binding-like beta-propeller repeat protein, partial [Flavobacteriales bacterium]
PAIDDGFIPVSRLSEDFEFEITIEPRDSLANGFQSAPFGYQYSTDSLSVFCFRGNAMRNQPSRGTIAGRPTGVREIWHFRTAYDTVQTKYGKWGGGAGWTGQPSLVQWSAEEKIKLGIEDPEFLGDDSAMEVIIGSLCGNIYFIDAARGIETREHLSIGNPIKGSISVDPRKNGLLYVGQGIPKTSRMGAYVFDMFDREEHFHINGFDRLAPREWGAFDSNPVINSATGQVIWPAENGLIYTFAMDSLHQIHGLKRLRYSVDGMSHYGIESSPAIIGSYGFVADNEGNVLCFDIATMKPVWNVSNEDDTDATIAIDEETPGNYFLYTGNEVDLLGPEGTAYLRKRDATTGEEIWRYGMRCFGSPIREKPNSGGILASPVIGKHQGNDLVYCIFSRTDEHRKGALVAIHKSSGEEIFVVPMDRYSWASPVDFYDDQGNIYLFLTDVGGRFYLLDGLTGEILFKKEFERVMEASPVIIGNRIYLATRGRSIFCYEIETGTPD